MATVAFLPHHERAEAAALAKAAIARLEGLGHTCRVPAGDAAATGLETWSVPEALLTGGLDLAVCLGGDGTMLRTIDLVGRHGVPVLGVNVGHLGYLTEVEPATLDESLDRFLVGRHQMEERMLLEVLLARHGEDPQVLRHAMNEAVVRSAGSHMVRLEVSIAGELFTSYAADGLIVATPTGSTAYNLSARGPIVAPELHAFVVTPVAPHQLFDRSLVLSPEDDVRVELLDWRPARLLCDGVEVAVMAPGDVLTCRRGPWAARFVTFGRRDFRGILRKKFGLEDR
ncbi:MAG: NAD(+)/NADH kinase [Acidimicrobiales bacterium]